MMNVWIVTTDGGGMIRILFWKGWSDGISRGKICMDGKNR